MSNAPDSAACPVEIWSCNPADIKPWSVEDKARLHTLLAQTFGWAEKPPPVPVDAPSEAAPAVKD